MPRKNKRSTAADAAATTKAPVEPLKPGHTRAQGSRQRWDHNGDPLEKGASRSTDDTPENPS